MDNAQTENNTAGGLSVLTNGLNVQTEICECCNGIGMIRDTEFIDGDERPCMTCNGSGHFTYIPNVCFSDIQGDEK